MATPASRRGRQVTALQAVALLVGFVLIATIGGVLSAGLLMPSVVAAKQVTDTSKQAFDDLPTALERKPLSQKSVILAADGTKLAEFYVENRVVVPLSEIAPIMRNAVIAVEDKRFYDHGGIDPQGMLRAAVRTLAGNKEGASTLTQQYVKNVLIEEAQRAGDVEGVEAARESDDIAGVARKLREAKLAITLETTMTKDDILEGYLNIAQFGVSLYGVEAAAQHYFSKSAADLTYLEAATLAGITQSPTKWDPERNPELSETRRNTVLRLMAAQKYITADELAAGLATPVASTLVINKSSRGCMQASDAVPGSGFFCDYVTKVILNDPAFGATAEDRNDLLTRGGLVITTTLDPREQTIADAKVKEAVPVDDPSDIGAAMSVVEPGTGKITAMAQNRTYNNSSEAGPRETAVNWNADYAHGGSSGFPAGSTFKPFTLLEWLTEGHALNETVDAKVRPYPLSEFNTSSCGFELDKAQVFKFGNSEGSGGGSMTVLNGTKNSVNSAYINMASQLDLCKVMEGAASLGVVNPNPASNGGKTTIDPYPANVIGSSNVTPLSMANAFATFASSGTYCTPIAITDVTDADGNAVLDSAGKVITPPSANCQAGFIDPNIANGMAYALSQVWTGTAKSPGAPPFPAAGKTGTTTFNEYTWFVGFTPARSAAVWVGHADAKIQMRKVSINGSKPYPKVFGNTIAAPIWKNFMVEARAGLDNPAFATPDKKQVDGEQVSVPDVLGMDEATAKQTLTDAGFKVTIVQPPVDSTYAAGTVAVQTPSGKAARYGYISLTMSTGVAPPAADPAAQNPAGVSGTANPSQGLPGGPGGNGNGNGNGNKP